MEQLRPEPQQELELCEEPGVEPVKTGTGVLQSLNQLMAEPGVEAARRPVVRIEQVVRNTTAEEALHTPLAAAHMLWVVQRTPLTVAARTPLLVVLHTQQAAQNTAVLAPGIGWVELRTS